MGSSLVRRAGAAGSHRRFISGLWCLASIALFSAVAPPRAAAQCSSPANAIVAENCLPGNPSSEWDLNSDGAGDSTIQGFATDISVNQGGTISFKINTPARAYAINIYRMGFYGGKGARKVASVTPSVLLPQTQPACLTNSSTGLYDCGNWAVSASWQVPATATSGIYFAHLIRTDNGGDSHIMFIVRNDASHSDMLFQTSDETWQAYNYYGGGSVYGPASDAFSLGQRAYKVSYNRPFLTRGFGDESASWVFGAEYPMVRFLESNGYDVTYFTGVDAARSGALIKNHKLYVTCGHDEYWSGPHRTNVEAARDAGVHMAFFSGNEVFWKTRWENSIDGSNTAYRTLVCYKETLAFAKIDPQDPPTWTGTWRDPSFSPPADGGRPENSLTGTLFMVNGPGNDNGGNQRISVPSADGKMRFWRNTAVASLAAGSTYTLPTGTLGYEWDVDADNGARPAGAFGLSTSTYNFTSDYLLDFGATYGAGTATHHMMMYRAPSGALVFGAGTVQWSWGLDANHDNPFGFTNPNPDLNMQQATVNLFADMGVQPATLLASLLPATASNDAAAPSSVISSPSAGSSLPVGQPVTVSGTASDAGGGTVGGVEVSTDSGNTWHPATGRGSWSYTFTPTVVGSTTFQSRAVDDSGNLETPSGGAAETITAHDCPCAGYDSTTAPGTPDSGDGNGIEAGVKFRSDYNGYVTGVRFYKSSANTGTHVGNLWSSSGTLLARATFTSETGSGWQQVSFNSPVAITANTTYIASYFAPSGHYADQAAGFAAAGVDNPPVHLLKSGVDGPNGVYVYSSQSAFPNQTFNSTNYWVDVVFFPSGSMNGAPPALAAMPAQLSFSAALGAPNPAAQTVNLYNQGTSTLNWNASASAPWIVLGATSGTTPQNLSISVNTSGLAAGSYSGTVTISAPGAANSPQTVTVNLIVTNVLLSTNFTAQGLAGWLVAPGSLTASWSIVNSVLQYNGNNDGLIYTGNSAWTDYTVTSQFKLSTLQNYPGGLRGRVNPSTGAGYMVWVYPQSGQIILFAASAWSIDQPLTQLASASGSFDTTSYHTFALSFSGSNIQVIYDGNVVISVTDSTYANGLIALEGDNQLVSFASVVATATGPNTVTLNASPTSLTFAAAVNGSSPASQNVQLTASSGSLVWTASPQASWLTVSPTGASTTSTLQVTANPAGLAAGSYSSTVTLVALGAMNVSQTVNVTFNVTTDPPPSSIVVAPTSLAFTGVSGGQAPSPQTVSVTNGGSGSFSWSVASDSTWLTASPTSGSTPGSFAVSASAASLPQGTYTGNLTVTAAGVSNSPLTIPVTFQVSAQTTTYGISGSVTPASSGSGTTLTLSGTASKSTTADASGNFSFSGLANGSYTVTPSKTGYSFSPASQSVTVNGGNITSLSFTATAVPTYSISGNISPSASGSGTLVALSGAATASITADTSGNFSFANLSNGAYTITPSKTGFTFTPASQSITVNNASVASVNFTIAPTSGGGTIAMDAKISVDAAASTTVKTASFSTTSSNELLLAFISTDYLSGTNTQVSSVTGAGSTWVLVRRTNTQFGSSEIWRASSATPLTGTTVTATLSKKVVSSMTVMTFTGIDLSGSNGSGAIGATQGTNSSKGAPSASLVTTRNYSLVIGVGNDWDNATSRTLGTGQSMVHQNLTSTGDTYWVQMRSATTALSGTTVTINDTAPAGDRYNLSICEILAHP